MVDRIKTSYGSISKFGSVMQPESIRRLASYIYVDKELVKKIVSTGLEPSNVDQLRAILSLNMSPGFDISGPLDAYDGVVMAMAAMIVEENSELIENEIRQAQLEALGLEEPKEEIIREEGEKEIVEGAAPVEQGVAEVYVPEKISVKHGKEGVVTQRAKAVSWRKRGQKGLSQQEQFIYVRRGQSVEQVQAAFSQRFRIYRSTTAIKTKQYRLSKKVNLGSLNTRPSGVGESDIIPR